MLYEFDFAKGEAEFNKALALDPNDAIAHAWYGLSLGLIGGREQEAAAEVTRAHQLDPQSPVITQMVAIVYRRARQYDEAIAVCTKLEESPTFASKAHDCLAGVYWAKKMYPQVLEEWKIRNRLRGRPDDPLITSEEQAFRSEGWGGVLHVYIDHLLKQRNKTQPSSDDGSNSALGLARSYAELGEKEQAFQWLNVAFQEHDNELTSMKTAFQLDPIRSDPRFAEVVRKVGLPQ